ncbi:YceD family protein [Staphylococcus simulans]|uniref:YceD family protein n=1 Tax=Staphylococcus simulans TaxID=1286 RepID=UPI0021D190C7|nr:YceD family protein [Staphylococcus simulans]UXV43222.1 YceD family protein [Staphylococcus simulans]
MKWSITQLRKYQGQPFEFDQTVNYNHLIDKLGLIDLSDIRVKGKLDVKSNEVVADIHLTGAYTMEDARTLKPVEVPIDVETTEIFDLEGHEFSGSEEDDEHYHLATNGMIDLRDIAEELVIIEKPIRAVAEDSSLEDMLQSGQGWEVIDEDELEESEQAEEISSKKVDPRLQKLQQFYDEKQ